jgi:hypothetical protein
VIEKGVTTCELLNYFKSVDRDDETFDPNMIVSLDEVGRTELIVGFVGEQWQLKEKKIVDLHRVTIDPLCLDFCSCRRYQGKRS